MRPVACGAIVLGALLGACSSSLQPQHEMGAEIVRVGPGLWSGRTDGPFQIQVVFDPGDGCGRGIIFTIDSGTSILDSRAARTVPATQEILVVGANVNVTFDLVNDSCPGQSYASSVERLR